VKLSEEFNGPIVIDD
jgi:hypothetical protein